MGSKIEALFSPTTGIEPFVSRYGCARDQRTISPLELLRITRDVKKYASEIPDSIEDAVDRYTRLTRRLIHPEFDTILNQVAAEIEPEYTNLGFRNAGLVLVGSGFGGALTKDAAGRYAPSRRRPQDIDLVLVSDHDPSLDYYSTTELLQEKISDSITRISGGRFMACDGVNVKYAQGVNAKDQDFTLLLGKESKAYTKARDMGLSLYLFPSYPEERNRENLTTLLEELHGVHTDGGANNWTAVMEAIISQWQIKCKPFDKKFFGETHDTKNPVAGFASDYERMKLAVSEAKDELLYSLLEASLPKAA